MAGRAELPSASAGSSVAGRTVLTTPWATNSDCRLWRRQMGLHSMGLEHQSDATAAAAALLD